MITPKETSEIILKAMNIFACNQQELSHILEVSESAVSKWINERKSIGRSTLKVLNYEIDAYKQSKRGTMMQ